MNLQDTTRLAGAGSLWRSPSDAQSSHCSKRSNCMLRVGMSCIPLGGPGDLLFIGSGSGGQWSSEGRKACN